MVYDPQRDKIEANLRAQIDRLMCELEVARQERKAGRVDPIAALMQHYKIRPRQAMMLYAMHHGRQVSHWDLLSAASDEASIKIITVYICNLRKALREQKSSIKIETIWGRAYQIAEGLDELQRVIDGKPNDTTNRLIVVDSELLR